MKYSFNVISWNTKYFHEIFYLSIQVSCFRFSSIKKIVFTEKILFVTHKAKTNKNQKYQHVSEWNHAWKPGATKVHVLTYF